MSELSCFDQPHPSPAPSFWMWMKTEKENVPGDSPVLCLLYMNHTATICTHAKNVSLPQNKSNNDKGSFRENERFHQGTNFQSFEKITFLYVAHCLFWSLLYFNWKKTVHTCLPSFLIRLITFSIVRTPSINPLHHRLSVLCGYSEWYPFCHHPISSKK